MTELLERIERVETLVTRLARAHLASQPGEPREFAAKAAKLIVHDGRPLRDVAIELGIREEDMAEWVRIYKQRAVQSSDTP